MSTNLDPNVKVDRAKAEARRRWGYLTPYRMGLVAKDVGLAVNPYPAGTKAHKWFAEGSGITACAWPCGHPKTAENTQSIGVAGFRCRECRRRISRESNRRRRAAIADTHPKDGDVKQAPLVSGGGAEGNRTK